MTQVVVLAAGEGSRLYPFSTLIPKIMFPVGEEQISVAEYIIRHCKNHGITDFIFCINKCTGKYIRSNLKDGKHLGVKIEYSESESPLGTAGEIRHAYNQGYIKEDFIVYYGDTLSNVDLTDLTKEHYKRKATLSIVIHDTRIPVGFVKSNDGKLTSVIEKPRISEMFSADIAVFGAILPIFYISDHHLCKYMFKHTDLVSTTIAKELRPDKVAVYYYDGKFIDMGSWKNYTDSKNWETFK
jgi:NDP-mannose synthase